MEATSPVAIGSPLGAMAIATLLIAMAVISDQYTLRRVDRDSTEEDRRRVGAHVPRAFELSSQAGKIIPPRSRSATQWKRIEVAVLAVAPRKVGILRVHGETEEPGIHCSVRERPESDDAFSFRACGAGKPAPAAIGVVGLLVDTRAAAPVLAARAADA